MTEVLLAKGQKKRINNQVVVGLDMGTTKICAIVAKVNDDGGMEILGVGTHSSLGLRKGIVIDVDATAIAVREAVTKASEMANIDVTDLYVGIAGGHIDCITSHANVEISDPDRGISQKDIKRVLERAKGLSIQIDREIIHSIPQHYYVDDGPTHNPEKIASAKLEVDVLLITAAVTSAQNIIHAVHQADYQTAGIFLQPLASARALLDDEIKQLGVILLDIGGGTTDLALFTEGTIKYTAVIPFGGDVITSDINRGLGVSIEVAENIKKKYGVAIASSISKDELIEVPGVMKGQMKTINRRFLCDIIQARMEEILIMAREKISSAPHFSQIYGGVILTGGAALLPQIERLTENVFNLSAEVRFPKGLKGLSGVLESPIYSTAVGLVEYGFEYPEGYFPNKKNGSSFNWLKKIFENLFNWY